MIALSTGGSSTLNDHSVNYSELKRYDEGTFNLELKVSMNMMLVKKHTIWIYYLYSSLGSLSVSDYKFIPGIRDV